MEPNYIEYLSFDCAYKSFAYAHVRICTNTIQLMMETMRRETEIICTEETVLDRELRILRAIYGASSHFIQVLGISAGDILGGRKVADVPECERAVYLYRYLQGAPIAADKVKPNRVIIEHQPPRLGKFGASNTQSTAVSYQLAIYYAEFNPTFVDPKRKNNFSISGLTLETFTAGAQGRDKQYRARKAHTKANLLKLAEIFGIDLSGIPRPLLDDAADALWQILAQGMG